MAATGRVFTARVTVDGKRRRLEVAVPIVVGVTRAAELLDVPKSSVSRYVTSGRLVPVPQEGPGAPVFLKAEVVELAGELARERAQREARRGAAVEG
jgi:hypothetical protein